jgi:uncharacterized protein (PEP-CTERM system associated)
MRQGLGPIAWILLFSAGAGAVPAAAQVVGGTPGIGSTIDSLPPLPTSGYGVGGALSPGYAVNPDLIQAPPPSTRLGTLGGGVTTLQQYDPSAPAYLIRPTVAISEMLTDNARQTSVNRTADLVTHIAPGLSVSADTPRVQGVLTASFGYDKFIFASDQDRPIASLYSSSFVTVVPDNLFVDMKGSVSEASQLGAAGFTPVSQLPRSSLTPVISTMFSPYLRKSYKDLADAELRYSYSTTSTGGGVIGSALATSPAQQNTTALADTTTNQGTLTISTGPEFNRLISKLTIDASKTASTSVAANSRVTGYNDVEYLIVPGVSALGLIGYENIHYGVGTAATTVGVAWQVGGRLNLGSDTQYATIRYGKKEGNEGFTGAVHYDITPATILTAEASQARGSQQQQIANALTQSSLDLTGRGIINQNGLPTIFVNPAFSIQNTVFDSTNYSISIVSSIGVNRLSLFGTYTQRTTLGSLAGTSALPSTAVGVHFNWSRDIRPDLTGNLDVGYSTASNLTVSTANNPSTSTLINKSNAMNAALSLNYLFNETLTGSVAYNLSYQTNAPSFANASATTITVGNILTNQLIFALTKTF